MDGCFERLSAAIHRFEGTINQFTGDGIMALCGAPLAHEDHAERAVHAALAIQAAIAAYAQKLEGSGAGFRMRIGLHGGTVMVGRIGDNLRMDYTAQGDTLNLAARLEQACPIGHARGIWQHPGALGRALARMGREADARGAYRTALDTLGRTLPRIPDPGLRQTLLASEPVARLREEAATPGVTT
jgi:class 3 adenylate cyclase